MKRIKPTITFLLFSVLCLVRCGSSAPPAQEATEYEVFFYDNGPDYPSDGLFRIVQNDKIGYADQVTKKIVIQPQFDCAFPFENGKAKVSKNCTKEADGEHTVWVSEDWKYIDKTGKEVEAPVEN